MATPGRAKQAKVKSASLVKALLTTHPQGEEAWGSFLALRSTTFSPASPGGAPAAARGGHGATQRRSAHLRPRAHPAAAPGGQQPAQALRCASLSGSKVWKCFWCFLCKPVMGFISLGEVVKPGVRAGNTPPTPVLESGNKNFRRAFCKDLAYTLVINIVQLCSNYSKEIVKSPLFNLLSFHFST